MTGLDPAAIEALAKLGAPALWLIAVAFFAPPALSIILQTAWSARVKSLVAFAFYVVVAGVWVWLNDLFSVTGWIVATLIVFITAGTAYREAWKKLGVTEAIQNVTDVPQKQGRHEAGDPA